jgi:ADP-heptose:LPS heptosyltransferase
VLLKVLRAVIKFTSRGGKERPLPTAEVKSVLLVEMTRLGDVVSMLPAIRLFRSQFPSAEIHLFVDKRYSALLQEFDLKVTVEGIRTSTRVSGFLFALAQARRLKVDLACSMSPARRNALLALASGARYKVGYLASANSMTPHLSATPVEALGFMLQTRTRYSMENIETRATKICVALGFQEQAPAAVLELAKDASWLVRERLTAEGIIPSRRYVVIHPFAGWVHRMWSIYNFNTLVKHIVERLDYDVLLMCSEEEAHGLQSSRALFQNDGRVRFFSSRDLLDSAVVIQGASLFIGNDSGPLHLAAALRKRIVGFFGPASPDLTAPLHASGEFIYKRVECSPCAQKRCIRPGDSCMGLISPDEAFAAVVRSLSLVSVDAMVVNG